MATNTSDASGGLRGRREAAGLSQLDVARRAPCSPAMVGLLERGYKPHRSAVLDRIQRVLNDEAPAGNGRQVTTSAGVGDGHVPV